MKLCHINLGRVQFYFETQYIGCCLQELQPLVFMFDLPSFPVSTTVYEGSRVAIIQQVQQTHRVTVSIRPHQRSIQASVVIVRGSVGDYKAVKEATTVLFEQLTGSIGVCSLLPWCFRITKITRPLSVCVCNTCTNQSTETAVCHICGKSWPNAA